MDLKRPSCPPQTNERGGRKEQRGRAGTTSALMAASMVCVGLFGWAFTPEAAKRYTHRDLDAGQWCADEDRREVSAATSSFPYMYRLVPAAFPLRFAAACTQDSDCVPSICCHPSSCVERSRAPNCGPPPTVRPVGSGGAASNGHTNGRDNHAPPERKNPLQCPVDAECAPFTLDCGGRCFCTALGECGAIVNMGVGLEGKKVNGNNEVAAGGDPNFVFVPPPPKKKRVRYGYGYIRVKGPHPKKKRH